MGREIALDLFDFEKDSVGTGEKLGEMTVKIVGVIKTSPNRTDKEYYQFFNNDGKIPSTPVVYLYYEDEQSFSLVQTYAYIEHKGSDVYTEDFYREYTDFSNEMLEKGLFVGQNMEAFCVSSLVNFAYQSEDEGTRIYPSDTTVAIRYFSILAVIISSIALFGVLYPIITEREKTLDTVRSIGASKRRKYMILFTEAIIFLTAGTLAGFALSAGIYELILLIQKNLLNLPSLRGYTAEWGVERITEDPFVTSMICSSVLLTIGYMIYFLSKRRHSRKLLKKAPRLEAEEECSA